MKEKLYQFLRMATVAASFTALCTTGSLAADYVSVAKDGVNVRTGPSTSDPVYMELFEGYPLKVVEKNDNWLKVTDYEGDSGWIYAPLVADTDTVIVNASSSANMRSGPGTSNAIVATLERGVVLSLLERQGKWVKVRHASGTQGWIYSPLVWP